MNQTTSDLHSFQSFSVPRWRFSAGEAPKFRFVEKFVGGEVESSRLPRICPTRNSQQFSSGRENQTNTVATNEKSSPRPNTPRYMYATEVKCHLP